MIEQGSGAVVAIDWPGLERQARRVAVAKAPLADVAVAFHPDGRRATTLLATWQGQVYGSLAVCLVGDTPPRCEALADAGWYQLVHVPTGLYLRSHRKAPPLRALALALNDLDIDWAAMDGRGLAWLPEGRRRAARDVVGRWEARMAGDGAGRGEGR